jgi:hypothetical protein
MVCERFLQYFINIMAPAAPSFFIPDPLLVVLYESVVLACAHNSSRGLYLDRLQVEDYFITKLRLYQKGIQQKADGAIQLAGQTTKDELREPSKGQRTTPRLSSGT